MQPRTILLAEDEESIRRLVKKLLESRGFQVLEAQDGLDALDIASNFKGEISLLVTDIRMPGLNGIELANRLCQRSRGLRVLYMSGYHGVLDLAQTQCSQIPMFTGKPFSPALFLKTVDDAMNHPAPPTV